MAMASKSWPAPRWPALLASFDSATVPPTSVRITMSYVRRRSPWALAPGSTSVALTLAETPAARLAMATVAPPVLSPKATSSVE